MQRGVRNDERGREGEGETGTESPDPHGRAEGMETMKGSRESGLSRRQGRRVSRMAPAGVWRYRGKEQNRRRAGL